ncbi:MAG: hydantoinase/oxoprolinase family protein [Planctomycetota bacterium]|jgi:N-methylhydantoinase A
MRIGVDVGGTFTDVVLAGGPGGATRAVKVLTTPAAPADGVLQGIAKVCGVAEAQAKDVAEIIHGTTLGTNALIERKGAKTALLTSAGFRDVLEIGRIQRPDEGLYDVNVDTPLPLVPRYLRLEATERVGSKGEVVTPLDEATVQAAAEVLKREGVEAIAVTFLFSFLHPEHEERTAAILADALPGVAVSLSSKVAPEFREFERTSTTVIDAYLKPKMDGYLATLSERVAGEVGDAELRIMQASGGSMALSAARARPIRTVNSGPAGGAVAAALVSQVCGVDQVVAVDMGGTSFDISLVTGGKPTVATEGKFEGYPVKMPLLDTTAIGAGGGSIAWIDRGGALNVGPESASSVPGPACYGRGGERPTVTDANVVLGRINPEYFLGGEMQLDLEAARNAIKTKVADPLGLSIEEAAAGIVRVVDANMVKGIAAKTTQMGLDVRDMAIVAFGGAGALHAAGLGQEMGVQTVLVPPFCSTLSAFGLTAADLREDNVAVIMKRRSELDVAALTAELERLTAAGVAALEGPAGGADKVQTVWQLDLRFEGQSYELAVEVQPGTLDQAAIDQAVAGFNALHEKIYAFSAVDEETELVNARAICTVPAPQPQFVPPTATDLAAAKKGQRTVYFPGAGALDTVVYERTSLPLEASVAGPAVIEEPSSTTVVPPGASVAADANGVLRITLG